MDEHLRPDLLPADGRALGVQVAPAALRRDEGCGPRDGSRERLGPALLVTPLVTVGRWRCPADSALFADSGPARAHLFVFPRTSVWIAHEGDRRFVADPTVVTYYNAGQRYRRHVLSAAGDRGEWFAVPPDVLAQVLAIHDPAVADRDRLFPFTHGPSDRDSYLRQRAVFAHVSQAAVPDVLLVEETVLEVLGRVTGLAYGRPDASPGANEPGGRDLAEAARAVLARRYTTAASLRDVAREAGASPFHLARVFKRATGATLHAHRTELRLRASLEPLASPRCDLLALALSLGYASHSHFSDVFRRAFGAPPSIIRGRLTARHVRDLRGRLCTLRH